MVDSSTHCKTPASPLMLTHIWTLLDVYKWPEIGCRKPVYQTKVLPRFQQTYTHGSALCHLSCTCSVPGTNLKSCSLVKRRRRKKRHISQGSINQPIQIVIHAVHCEEKQWRGEEEIRKWRSLVIKRLTWRQGFWVEIWRFENIVGVGEDPEVGGSMATWGTGRRSV